MINKRERFSFRSQKGTTYFPKKEDLEKKKIIHVNGATISLV